MSTRSHYLDNATLARLVTTYRRTRRGGNELAAALTQIAGGVWDRYRFTSDRDDFTQDVVLHLMQAPLRKLDVQLHPFNYLTTCAIRYGLKLRDQAHGDRRRFQTYAAELLESGRPVVLESDVSKARRGQPGLAVVGRPGDGRGVDEQLAAVEAEDLARDLLAAIDGIREDLAATRAPRRRRPTPAKAKRAPRRRRRGK